MTRERSWPTAALTAMALAGLGAPASAATVLPTGGLVQAGVASIGKTGASALTVNQSSSRAVINWSSFSIGAGGQVRFENGSGVTLNRITGGNLSQINGLLTATGSVYVLNPDGVIVGKGGVVNVGGGFVAATLGLDNSQFMAGGALTFTGASAAPVANSGLIDARAGDVALIGASVRNDGTIEAPNGVASLAAGQSVVLLDSQSDAKINVLIGGPDTSVTNTGLIAAASAELRANGGNIYALAVNAGSRIEATGVTEANGNVYLIADGGSVTAEGEITASGKDGAGGQVETSGAAVDFTGLAVKASNWLIDPVNLTVDAASATTIDADLATTNIALRTTATGASGPGVHGPGAGDIIIASPINWSSAKTLTLDAYHSIAVDADITVAGAGKVVFKTDDGGAGGDYGFAPGASLEFTNAPGGGQGLAINGQAYTLVYSQADLININTNLAGFYALAAPLDLQGSTPTPEAFSAAPIAPLLADPFTGAFTGLGNSISNLSIAKSVPVLQDNGGYATNGAVGMFGWVGPAGVVRDVALLKASVAGGDGMGAGTLVGNLQGTVLNSYSSGEVDVGAGVTTSLTSLFQNGFAYAGAGGLVGSGDGVIRNSSSSANVYGGNAFAGGLIGSLVGGGVITGSSASGNVNVGDFPATGGAAQIAASAVPEAGGLVGLLYGYDVHLNVVPVTVTSSYATGSVHGGAAAQLGGFVGDDDGGSVDSAYATGAVSQSAAGQNGFSDDIGGFAGLLTTGAVVTQSYSSGPVSAAGGTSSFDTFAGGFVGAMGRVADSTPSQAASISNSYSLSSVSTSGSYNFTGGFAGLVIEGANLDHVYASGTVTGSYVLGGLAALLGDSEEFDTSGYLSNSYWDEGTTGQTSGYNLSGTGTATAVTGLGGSTNLSPYASANYGNFDLANTWFLIEGETRPILRSEYSTTITDAHQLQLMALDLTADYTLAGDIDASETANPSGVWNPANGFVPVGGNGAAAFTGTLDGQGHTISSLTIIDTTLANGLVGVFGLVGAGGVAQNINLSNVSVTGGDGMLTGALAGQVDGLVSNVTSSGLVTGGNSPNTGSPVAVGGLVGNLDGALVGSHSSATVTSGADAFSGGLVGDAFTGATISGSFGTGAVSTGGYDGAGNIPLAGGLLGGMNGGATPVNVTDSYATGDVTGGAASNIGGFAGNVIQGQITTSYATGSVTQADPGQNARSNTIGGFAGYVGVGGTIAQSWSSGVVISAGGPNSGLYTLAGGFAGSVDQGGSVSEAYSLGAVSTPGGAFNAIGSFAGYMNAGANIDHVYATGLVTGSGTVGGVVGQLGHGGATSTLSDSYWDEGTTGQTVAYGNSDNGTGTNLTGVGGATGLSPYASASYANFDLTNTWFMIDGETRPILRVEYSTAITNAHQLQLMALYPTASYTLANDIDASETTSPSGVWNPTNGFVPVGGNGMASFTGSLDGQGHSISNLTVIDTTASETTEIYVGLFGYVSGANSLLQNINLVNVDVAGGDGMWTGALVGYQRGGTIQNATSSGSVSGGNVVSNDDALLTSDVGGLVGLLDDSSISNSSSSTTVTGGEARVGGLVGSVADSTISSSFAAGRVTVGSNLIDEVTAAGGLVGLLQGETSATSTIVTGSYATGAVLAGGGAVAGGLVGQAANAQITSSYATGSVTQTGGGQNGVASQAGGFAGYLNSSIVSQDFATGSVTTVAGPSTSLATLAGGFVGGLDNELGAQESGVSESYARGAVTVTGGAESIAGGFAGMIEEGATANHVYATGLVTASGVVGGLVGQVGNATATDTSGSITNSVWDTGATGQTVGYTLAGTGTTSGVTGLTTAQMQDPANYATNFAGWDFTNTWAVPSSGFYPELYGVSHVLRFQINDISYEYGDFPIYSGTFTGIQVGEQGSFTWNINNFTISGQTTSSTGYYNTGVIDLTSSGSTASDAVGDYRVIEVDGTLTVTPRPLDVTLSGSVSKVYDGTAIASLTGLTYQTSGLIGSDQVSVTATSAVYDTKDVGTGKEVTANGFALTGADAADYSLDSSAPAPIGVITPLAITATLTGAIDKAYDGTTTASLAPGDYVLAGVISGDTVTLGAASGTYDTPNVGTGKTVSFTGLMLGGADGADYTVNTSASAAIGEIDAKALTVTLTGVVSKTYDGTTAATLTSANYGLTGVVGDDAVTLNDPASGAYDTKDVGTGKTVNVTGLKLTGADALNYTVSSSASAAIGEIDPATLTATLIGVVSKTYDGTTAATLTLDNYRLTGVIGGDTVTLNDPASGAYDTANAGTGKIVTVTGLKIQGADALDYTVNTSAAAPIGVVNASGTAVSTIIPNIVPQPQLSSDEEEQAPSGSAAVAGAIPAGSNAPSGAALTEVAAADSPTDPSSDFAAPMDDTLTASDVAAVTTSAAVDSSVSGKSHVATAGVFPVGSEPPNPRAGIDTSPVTGAGNRDLWTGVDESAQFCGAGGNPSQPCGGKPGAAP